jgi:transcription elongation factor Elf1
MTRIAYNNCNECGRDGNISITSKEVINNCLSVKLQCSNCGHREEIIAPSIHNNIDNVKLYDIDKHDEIMKEYEEYIAQNN